jgi:hypothetical protein
MLYNEIIAVCSQIRTKHINTLCGQNVPRSKHILSYINQSVDAVHWNDRCLFSDSQKTHKYTVGRTYRAVNTLRLGYKNQWVNAVYLLHGAESFLRR